MKNVRFEAKNQIQATSLSKMRYTTLMAVPIDPKDQGHLGKKLREIRELKGLSQKEVADDVGIDVSYYAGIERGEKNPTFSVLMKLCRVLKIRSSQFLPL